MRIQESKEMYLETILILHGESERVRAIDIVNYTGYTKPSVSRAVGLLKSGGYIVVGQDGEITLTEIGNELAARIYERHTVLTDLLVSLGVNKTIAAEDACKIEHVISTESFEAIKKLNKK